MSEEKGVYILQKKNGLQSMRGLVGRPRTILQGVDKDGQVISEDKGDYLGEKLPQSREDVVPEFDSELGKWNFYGDASDLQRLVKAIRLRYPKNHPDAGKVIEKADVRDRMDAFFDNPKWFDNPKQMIGSNVVMNTKTSPSDEFLLLCSLGNRLIQDSSEEVNPYEAAGIKFEVIKSTSNSAKKIKASTLEIDLVSSLGAMSNSKAMAISIIMGLIYNLKGQSANVDEIKPNLLEAIKKVVPNPGDKKLYEGKSFQDFYIELKDKKIAELNKMVNIRKAMLNNSLRYKDGMYNLNGKDLVGVNTFSKLVTYFSEKENTDDYANLINLIEV